MEWPITPIAPERDCDVCGSKVMFGSRHHQCGSALMTAEKAAKKAAEEKHQETIKKARKALGFIVAGLGAVKGPKGMEIWSGIPGSYGADMIIRAYDLIRDKTQPLPPFFNQLNEQEAAPAKFIDLEPSEEEYLIIEINTALREVEKNSPSGVALNSIFFKLTGKNHEKHKP
jgi:hypothetical protein